MAKLTWFNAEYIRSLDLDAFHQLVRPYFARAIDVDRFDTRRLAELMQPRCELLPDVVDKIGFLSQLPDLSLIHILMDFVRSAR